MRRLPSILQRLDRLERHGAHPDIMAPSFNPARKLRGLRDLHAWINSRYRVMPFEPTPKPGTMMPSRVAAMADAGADLLASVVVEPLIEHGRTPASLSLDELRASWGRIASHYTDELPNPMFAVDDDELEKLRDRQREARRPDELPMPWAELARRVDALRATTPTYVGDPESVQPDASFV